MAMVEGSRVDDRLGVGIPDDEIGIASDGDRALPRAEAREALRGRRPASRRDARAEVPRSAAPVQTADSPSWSEAMPPQASRKSPSSRRFSAGGAGE